MLYDVNFNSIMRFAKCEPCSVAYSHYICILNPHANGRNVVGQQLPTIFRCYTLRPFAHLVHVVVCCRVLLVVDAQSLKTVKRYPGADGRNNSQHCWAKKIGSCCVHLHVT